MDENWIEILNSDKAYRIEIAKQALLDEGIESVVMNQKDSSYLIGDVCLYVRKEFAERASEILKNLQF
jgi:hypothetical protein